MLRDDPSENYIAEDLRPCPACPDGNVWDSNGPTGKTCSVCNGHAVVTLSGAPIAPMYVPKRKHHAAR